jgi:hypothetical protein
MSEERRSPAPESVDYTYARRLPRLVCAVVGHRWELVDDTEERKVRIVVPPGSDVPIWFVHDQTCARCGAEAWAETAAA